MRLADIHQTRKDLYASIRSRKTSNKSQQTQTAHCSNYKYIHQSWDQDPDPDAFLGSSSFDASLFEASVVVCDASVSSAFAEGVLLRLSCW
jgi:hypothetical protein